jgi:hypothetical protein
MLVFVFDRSVFCIVVFVYMFLLCILIVLVIVRLGYSDRRKLVLQICDVNMDDSGHYAIIYLFEVHSLSSSAT